MTCHNCGTSSVTQKVGYNISIFGQENLKSQYFITQLHHNFIATKVIVCNVR